MGNYNFNMSKSEAVRLIKQGAVKVNDQVVKDRNYIVKKGDLVKVGKRRYLRAI